MGLSRDDQKRLMLDILKSHQSGQMTRRNELDQLQRLTSTLQNQVMDFGEQETLNQIQDYYQVESQNPNGACETSAEDLNALIQKVEQPTVY